MATRNHDSADAGQQGRRGFLRGLLCAAPVALLVTPLRSWASAVEVRNLTLHNTHTGESLRVTYAQAGAYEPTALTQLQYLLRDHRNGEEHPIDPALYDYLHEVAVLADRTPEFEVISGYRSPATNAMLHARSNGVAQKSLHLDGKAIDIRLVGSDIGKVRQLALGLGRGGVGYYRESNFVHLDTGRVRSWGA
jgi:uncharacterized protein YcbK (DUF882 family)